MWWCNMWWKIKAADSIKVRQKCPRQIEPPPTWKQIFATWIYSDVLINRFLPAAEIINILMKNERESRHPESIQPVVLLWGYWMVLQALCVCVCDSHQDAEHEPMGGLTCWNCWGNWWLVGLNSCLFPGLHSQLSQTQAFIVGPSQSVFYHLLNLNLPV